MCQGSWFRSITNSGVFASAPAGRDYYDTESKTERYRRERNEADDKVTQLTTELEDLQGLLFKEQEQVKKTKLSANQMQTQLDNKELFLGFQANDAVIRDGLQVLLSEIKTWSMSFTGNGIVGAFRQEDLSQYTKILPTCVSFEDINDLIARKKQKRLFIRGWAVYNLSRLLFRTLPTEGEHSIELDHWLEESTAKLFAELELRLYKQGKLHRYHTWLVN